VKGIYHSAIEKLLADKKRFRIAAAVFVPLCLVVVGVTLALSAAPARAAVGQNYTYSNMFNATAVAASHRWPGGIDGDPAFCFDRTRGSSWNQTYTEIGAPSGFTTFTQTQATALRYVMALLYPGLTYNEMTTYWGSNIHSAQSNYQPSDPPYGALTAANGLIWLLTESHTNLAAARAGTLTNTQIYNIVSISGSPGTFGMSSSVMESVYLMYAKYKSALTTDIMASTLTVSSSGAALQNVGGTNIYGPFTVTATGLGRTLYATRPVTLGGTSGGGSDGYTYVNASNSVISTVTLNSSGQATFYVRVPTLGTSMTVNVRQTLPAYTDARFFEHRDSPSSNQRMVSFHPVNRYVTGSATFTTSGGGASTQIYVNKTASNSTGGTVPTPWSFTINLYNVTVSGQNLIKGTLKDSKTVSNSNSSPYFDFSFTSPGEYYYYIEESTTHSNGSSWAVSTDGYWLYINVSSSMQVTSRQINKNGGGWQNYTTSNITFNNVYTPQSSSVSATIRAKKNVSGNASGINPPGTWGSFDISIYYLGKFSSYQEFASSVTGTLDSTKQVSSGSPIASFTYSYTSAGFYYYRLRETSSSGSNWAIDTKEYLVEIEVYQNGSSLAIRSPVYYQTRSNSSSGWGSWQSTSSFSTFTFDFGNTFTPNNTTTQFGVQKNVSATSGSVPTSWSFSFNLRSSDINGTFTGSVLQTITINQSTGGQTLNFNARTLSTTGYHYFLIEETAPTAGSGWTLQTQPYLVRVNVRQNATTGHLEVYEKHYKQYTGTAWPSTWTQITGAMTNVEIASFNNQYQPSSVTTQFGVTKTATSASGAVPSSWSFSFTLYKSDASGNEVGGAVATATVNQGTPGFTSNIGGAQTLTSGDNYFLIKETAVSGWTTTATAYLIKVNVGTNTTTGNYEIKSKQYQTYSGSSWSGMWLDCSGALTSTYNAPFNNQYQPSSVTTQFGVTKTATSTSGAVPSTWSFSFTLYKSDASGNEVGGAVATATVNQGTPGFTSNIGGAQALTPGDNYFLIKETAVSGWTTAATAYLIKVNVGTNTTTGNYEIKSKQYQTYSGSSWSGTWLDCSGALTSTYNAPFSNEYQASSVTTQLGVTKSVTAAGSSTVPPAWTFSFTLYKSDINGAKVGSSIGTAAVAYNTPSFRSDIGGAQTLTLGDNFFLIEETAVGGWTTTTTAYLIKVNVGTNTTTGNYEIKTKEYKTFDGTNWSTPWVTCSGALGSTYDAPFSNEYQPTSIGTELKITKFASGTSIPPDWTFDFEIYESTYPTGNQGAKIGPTISATESDPVATFVIPPFTNQGMYYYLIKETSIDGNGWAVSTMQYLVEVMVADDSGALTVYSRWVSSRVGSLGAWGPWVPYTDTNITFTNYFTPTSTTLQVDKTTSGNGRPSTWEFDISIYKSDSDGGSLVFMETKQVSNGSATASFATGLLTTAGPHYFVIKETSEDEDGWKVSAREFLVKVTVGGTSALTVTNREVFYRDPPATGWTAFLDYPEANITFDNTYDAGFIFPEVGGIGTAPFRTGALILSCLLLFLAGAFLYYHLRKRRRYLME